MGSGVLRGLWPTLTPPPVLHTGAEPALATKMYVMLSLPFENPHGLPSLGHMWTCSRGGQPLQSPAPAASQAFPPFLSLSQTILCSLHTFPQTPCPSLSQEHPSCVSARILPSHLGDPVSLPPGLPWGSAQCSTVRKPEFASWLHFLAEHLWAAMFMYRVWNGNGKCRGVFGSMK